MVVFLFVLIMLCSSFFQSHLKKNVNFFFSLISGRNIVTCFIITNFFFFALIVDKKETSIDIFSTPIKRRRKTTFILLQTVLEALFRIRLP